jgi:polyphosphate:AMP phosphotransferase
MFEAAELGLKIPKDEYRAREPILRGELLDAQNAVRSAGTFPVIVVFAGVDGAGKGETVNLLNEWLDPRWVVTRAFGEPSDEERERPDYWRFWRALPPRGRIGLFLKTWYSQPVVDRAYGRITVDSLEERLNRIVEFEQMLAADGALILKFWMHLGKSAQRRRLKSLEKDPLQRWRVDELAWKHWRMYDKFIAAAERTVSITNRADAPWTIVEGEDARYRSLTVGEAMRDAIRRHLDERETRVASVATRGAASQSDAAPRTSPGKGRRSKTSILSNLDMTQQVEKGDADERIIRFQGQLNQLQRKAYKRRISTIVVFEGWDAAGKGGAIRRITAALDARRYRVLPVAAPTDEERAQHYLWRFWRHLDRAGRVTIFDRSWYGRVLVERVEGFAAEREWKRAYAEINQFERQLVQHGIVLLKYWLHITPDEQLRRFKDRESIPHKQWKLTNEDWRNRERWGDYELAVNDMIERTSTQDAPWTIIEGNDKAFARVKVLETACRQIQHALQRACHQK